MKTDNVVGDHCYRYCKNCKTNRLQCAYLKNIGGLNCTEIAHCIKGNCYDSPHKFMNGKFKCNAK